MAKAIIMAIFLLSALMLGCTNSQVEIVDSKAEQVKASALPTKEVKTFKVGNVGESLSNGKVEITLNSIEFEEIVPGTSSFSDKAAKDGSTFAIADITIENQGSEPTAISSIVQFKVKDPDSGYSYDMDLVATINLDQQIDGKIQPGDKVRGKIAFEVPKNIAGLQLVFDFGVFDGSQAKFNLGKS